MITWFIIRVKVLSPHYKDHAMHVHVHDSTYIVWMAVSHCVAGMHIEWDMYSTTFTHFFASARKGCSRSSEALALLSWSGSKQLL